MAAAEGAVSRLLRPRRQELGVLSCTGTLGPLDVDFHMPHKPYGCHLYAMPRNQAAAEWETPIVSAMVYS